MPELSELVEWQLLAGLQLLIEPYALITPLDLLGAAWSHVARAGVCSIVELRELPGSYQSRRAVEVAVIAARQLTSTPEEERRKDVWDLGVFGIREHRQIDFTHIRQRWLREAAKGYTLERMGSLRTQTAQRDVRWLGDLSDYLHARGDRGEQPGALTREDMTGFLSWLQTRVPAENRRHIIVSSTRRHVLFARRHLAGPGQPAEGIGGGFQLYHEDLPWRTTRDPDEPGRALPRVVLAQLLDDELLALLDAKYHEYRVAFELIAHTGRRPAEICHLPADCLRYDEEPAPGGGKQRRPVLRYRREKPPSKWASLPINQQTADLIKAQQQRLRERFPEIPFSKLPLLPRRRCNPTGRLAMTSHTLSNRVTKWIKRIPPLLDEDGTEYGREHVYLYALRHSYAQRHADAGVPIDTLQKLMDHRTTATTQGYYRVSWERKREAIERVAPLTMDRSGRRTGFHATLVETERLREEIGRIPSRSGTAPNSTTSGRSAHTARSATNASAASTSAPTPRTFPTSTPTSNGCSRPASRLRAAVPQLAEWAREKAIPADAEIKTVRTLIRAGEDALDELAPGERAKLLELFRVLRATRARMDGTIAVEQIAATRNPEPTFLPPAFTPLPSVRAAESEDAA
jgi:integrase